MKWDKIFSGVVCVSGGIADYLWGGFDKMLTILLTIMVLDVISGVLCGPKEEGIDSEKAFIGITKKKMMIFVMVAVGVVADRLINADGAIRGTAIMFYISMEGISILENAGRLGFPYPPKIKQLFAQLRDKD